MFKMFMKNVEKQLQDRCTRLEERNIELRNANDNLEEAWHSQKIEYDKLERLKKVEEEEVAHKIKMRDEQVGIEKDKAIGKAERDADKRVMQVELKYQGKLTEGLEKRNDELRTMYTEILARLPDVTVDIGGARVKSKK